MEKDLAKFIRNKKAEEEGASGSGAGAAGGGGGGAAGGEGGDAAGPSSSGRPDPQAEWNSFRWVGMSGGLVEGSRVPHADA